MKAVDFAYWLQGYFEVAGEGTTMTAAQAEKISQKAKTVDAGSGPAEAEARNFVSFTQGVLVLAKQPGADLALVGTTLKTRLNELFLHAIDPAVPGDQPQLRRTHRPKGDDSGFEIMC